MKNYRNEETDLNLDYYYYYSEGRFPRLTPKLKKLGKEIVLNSEVVDYEYLCAKLDKLCEALPSNYKLK